MIAVLGIGGALIAVSLFVMLFQGPPPRETDEQIIARRRRQAMRIVDEAYEQDHPWRRN